MMDLSKRLKRKPSMRMGSASPSPSPKRDNQHSRNARVMNHLKDSLISQLTKLDPSINLHPRDTSLIKRRLQRLFPSLHTPTHPPYAWMIRSAIIELKERATEIEISDFIKREYKDLPWAHVKILNVQLDKLCEVGEIARAEGGRYVLKVDDEKATEQLEGRSEKRKKGKRRSKRAAVETVQEESQEPRVQVFEKQSQITGTEAQGKAETQDSMLHLETTCSSQPIALTSTPAAGTGLLPAQLPLQMARDGPSTLVCSSNSNQKETCSSSHSAAPNSPVSPTHNSGHELLIPISEGSPECIASSGIKLPPTELHQQNFSDIDVGMVAKRKPSLTCEDVLDDNQATREGDLEEDPMSREFDQKLSKRPRGRLPKLETGANYPEESLLPLDDDTNNEQSPNIKKMKKRHQYGSRRGRGRPARVRGERVGTSGGRMKLGVGRGQGRSPKLNQIAQQCEEHLQQEDQDNQRGNDSGNGSGRSTGRGGRKPLKLDGSPIQYEEQPQQDDQDKHHGSGSGRGTSRGRGRPPKVDRNSIQYEKQKSKQEDQTQQHSQVRGRGRPRKLTQSKIDCEAQLLQEVQAKPQHVRGRGRGRPPKQNKNVNQCEEQSQDQAQVLLNTPSSGRGDNQSLEWNQLHAQSRGRCHKSEFEEAKPPAGLRLGSESRSGSGDVSQSNVDANQNCWRLQPVPGREGGRSLIQNQK